MAKIFISYKRIDKDKVFKIKDNIESALNVKCWIDLDGIESDAQFKNVIIKSINECEIVLFMYSKAHSKIIDIDDDWTIRELNFASKRKKRIVIINIDGSPLTDTFEFDYGTKQQIDGTSNESINKLIKDIEKWLSIERSDIQITTKPSYLSLIQSKIENLLFSFRKNRKKRYFLIFFTVLFILGYCNPSKQLEDDPDIYERKIDNEENVVNSIEENIKYSEDPQRNKHFDSSNDITLTVSGNTDGYDWCDLGLPSGTLWATCNIGASKPYQKGDFFSWGETTTKDLFIDKNYKFTNKNTGGFLKYDDESDNILLLEKIDDAAYSKWSKKWCIPSLEQFDELIDNKNTIINWITYKGIYGILLKSKINGNILFLPAAGECKERIEYDNEFGCYWSRNRGIQSSYEAYSLAFSKYEKEVRFNIRTYGLKIRPVIIN